LYIDHTADLLATAAFWANIASERRARGRCRYGAGAHEAVIQNRDRHYLLSIEGFGYWQVRNCRYGYEQHRAVVAC
jgi:hypothetical protein